MSFVCVCVCVCVCMCVCVCVCFFCETKNIYSDRHIFGYAGGYVTKKIHPGNFWKQDYFFLALNDFQSSIFAKAKASLDVQLGSEYVSAFNMATKIYLLKVNKRNKHFSVFLPTVDF